LHLELGDALVRERPGHAARQLVSRSSNRANQRTSLQLPSCSALSPIRSKLVARIRAPVTLSSALNASACSSSALSQVRASLPCAVSGGGQRIAAVTHLARCQAPAGAHRRQRM
jgi:hypothetical protein